MQSLTKNNIDESRLRLKQHYIEMEDSLDLLNRNPLKKMTSMDNRDRNTKRNRELKLP